MLDEQEHTLRYLLSQDVSQIQLKYVTCILRPLHIITDVQPVVKIHKIIQWKLICTLYNEISATWRICFLVAKAKYHFKLLYCQENNIRTKILKGCRGSGKLDPGNEQLQNIFPSVNKFERPDTAGSDILK